MTNETETLPAGSDDAMGRPPINDAPMTPAERQRRRRQRLRREPWSDTRTLVWSVIAALRGLRTEPGTPVDDAAVAALIDRAAEEIDCEADDADKVVAALTELLDPATPLPERGDRGHRFGDRRRQRHQRRHGRRHGGHGAGDED